LADGLKQKKKGWKEEEDRFENFSEKGFKQKNSNINSSSSNQK
jgi:hypothetical protein